MLMEEVIIKSFLYNLTSTVIMLININKHQADWCNISIKLLDA